MILAVLQARFSSSRLPGKILKPILGRPMVLRQVTTRTLRRRLRREVLWNGNVEPPLRTIFASKFEGSTKESNRRKSSSVAWAFPFILSVE